ncbi:MAG: glycosyltransferase family 9 protein, partial [Candidatus Kapaibacterium sp.]
IRLIRRIKHNGYDLAVDLLDNRSATSSILIRNCGASRRLGFDKENRGIYSHIVPRGDRQREHIVERFARLLTAFGVDPEGIDLSLEYPLSDEEIVAAREKMGIKQAKLRIGINLAGSDRAKFWGTDNNVDFIKIISDKLDCEVRIFALPDYSAEVDEICRRSPATPAPAAGSVHEYAALLRTCDAIVTPDTAAVHFAAAWKIPALAMYNTAGQSFGGIPWYPWQSPHRALTTSRPPLSNIPVAEAVAAFLELGL